MSKQRKQNPQSRREGEDRAKASEPTTREPRTQRATEERPSDAWQPSSVLPTPNPRQGIVHRWIRTSLLDRTDAKNVSKKFREGWEPVKADDYPEIKAMSDIDSRFKDSIEIGGLVLCAINEEKIRSRREYHENMAQNQMRAVDEGFMQDNDPRMRKFSDKKSRTEFGRG